MTAAPRYERASRGEARSAAPVVLDREALADDLRRRVFPAAASADSRPRIGAEVEIIPIESATGRPLPLDAPGTSTLAILRRAGAAAGWRERRSAKANVPEVELPDGGRITFEPGGQIEISSAPNVSLSALVSRASHDGSRDTGGGRVEWGGAAVVWGRSADEGRRCRATAGRGPVPPHAPALRSDRAVRCSDDAADRVVPGVCRRWRRARAHVDACSTRSRRSWWRCSRALRGTPIRTRGIRVIVATSGRRSTRAGQGCSAPAGAIRFPSISISRSARRRFCCRTSTEPRRRSATGSIAERRRLSDWCTHLSTLFPEVRPRGYFEVRSADVMAPEWYAVPLVLVAGLVYHRPSLDAAADLLGAPDPASAHARRSRRNVGSGAGPQGAAPVRPGARRLLGVRHRVRDRRRSGIHRRVLRPLHASRPVAGRRLEVIPSGAPTARSRGGLSFRANEVSRGIETLRVEGPLSTRSRFLDFALRAPLGMTWLRGSARNDTGSE